MKDVHVAVADGLAAEAMRAAKLPAGTPVQAVIRFALAKLAGWPDAAALHAARARAKDGA